MQFFEVPATARISFGIYNTMQEIDGFIGALDSARRMLD
jgi:selenocysteine lyase/cysteine desulfurase